mmetsp:Transcript_49160/g.67015  ORF Transcript_49160/g.67015 Transcript_49160/m.67015 type:complete len:154 (-) Transcript_49160:109-570(-)
MGQHKSPGYRPKKLEINPSPPPLAVVTLAIGGTTAVGKFPLSPSRAAPPPPPRPARLDAIDGAGYILGSMPGAAFSLLGGKALPFFLQDVEVSICGVIAIVMFFFLGFLWSLPFPRPSAPSSKAATAMCSATEVEGGGKEPAPPLLSNSILKR